MPRNKDESPEDYKKRILDPISPTFCAAKWLNATILLGAGKTKSCHHPPDHTIPVQEVQFDHKALHNTKHKMEQRKKMLDGERPDECSYCWRVEDSGAIADRVFYTSFYEDDSIKECGDAPFDTVVNPEVLEIAFDRICNFACSYCNPMFSTKWGNDIKRNGAYDGLLTPNTRSFTNDGKWAEPYGKLNENNPYVEAFWKWWPELSRTLKQLRITGGEPTMSPHFWKLVDMIKTDGIDDDMQFSVNSNLGIKDEVLDDLISFSNSIKRFLLFTSCESHGAQAEYIRDGLNYEDWKNNLWKVSEEANLEMLTCMMAVNGLCLDSITDFWDDLLELKRAYGWRYPFLSVNMVHYPSMMSPLVLPRNILDSYVDNIKQWLAKNEGDKILRDTEEYNIKKLISYLEHGKEEQVDNNRENHEHDFYHFYRQYDQRRNKSFVDTFSGPLGDWYISLGKKYNA